jgi:hypothetical protein
MFTLRAPLLMFSPGPIGCGGGAEREAIQQLTLLQHLSSTPDKPYRYAERHRIAAFLLS